MKGFAIEGYPNRDSLKYISLYNLNPAKLRTMFRGTLRYQGFSCLMDGLKEIGLLSHLPLPEGKSASWVILLYNLIIESFAWYSIEWKSRHKK
jgi:saccharopine dehydrogenase-like NADP-dependent oxidoreductase